MTKGKSENSWLEHLEPWSCGSFEIFDLYFMEQFGARTWSPTKDDKLAAHSLHIELISRIATQQLGYSTGVEKAALTSIFELFGMARSLAKHHPDGGVFEIVVWHVLNKYVRPFTAKWHGRSEVGELDALDRTDQFRAELVKVQNRLVALDEVLNKIRNVEGLKATRTEPEQNQSTKREFDKGVSWQPLGEIRDSERTALSQLEEQKIIERREHYGISDRPWASGIALSGGGIRSATFAMGVLVALSKRGLLHQFDYLSTVSGGGYTGSFLTQLLGTPEANSDLGLNNDKLPFRRSIGESDLLRRIRHGASFLSGSGAERFSVAMAQVHGTFITLFLVLCGISLFAYVDYLSRWIIRPELLNKIGLGALATLTGLFLILPIARGMLGWSLLGQQRWVSLLGGILLVPPLWAGLGVIHHLMEIFLRPKSAGFDVSLFAMVMIVGGFLIVTSAALLAKFSFKKPLIFASASILLIVLSEAAVYQIFDSLGVLFSSAYVLISFLLVCILWKFLDINSTSLHGYYRRKLAQAFLVDEDCSVSNPLKLSKIDTSLSLFPILNCALNVPGSIDPKMRGRKADLFSFSPVSVGSDLIGHSPTVDWELANPNLDLATAMALSGAAISPQMGLQTKLYKSFWLTLLNLRLGAWLNNPLCQDPKKTYPTIKNLSQELLATADENDAVVQISDGGHVENLGVYELLRRRCRFIVAVDGEHDASMTFHGLTNLQRLAYIDFGIVIDADLEDLRINNQNFSRSHFKFCRIKYPLGPLDKNEEIGYLIYMKLSLTGNEGEFIRRYKLDEPAFPHHSTADQFFNETQFEAYRSLGEHVGDKMFLEAITKLVDDDSMNIENWVSGLADSFEDPF